MITKLDRNHTADDIFVFGSNREGKHDVGAALIATIYWGAEYRIPVGFQGQSYAIITKELRSWMKPVTIEEIKKQIDILIEIAKFSPSLKFHLTKIGCGLAGFIEKDIAKLFKDAPPNIIKPLGW